MGRPGRKRDSLADRHPSGQIKRPYEDPRKVGLEARQRHCGISKEQAIRPESVDVAKQTLIKELEGARAGEVGSVYNSAIDEIRIRRTKYERAILAQRQWSASNFDSRGGHDARDGTDPAYVRRCQIDIRNWIDLQNAIRRGGGELALSLIHQVVIEGRAPSKRQGPLHQALNHALRHFAEETSRAA